MARCAALRRLLALCILLGLLAGHAPVAQAGPLTSPDAPLDTPEMLVAETVSSFSIADSKLFWHEFTPVDCDPDLDTKSWYEFIRRVAVQGSSVRDLHGGFIKGSPCVPAITSNIVSDGDHVFFVRGELYRLPVTNNVGDPVPDIAGDISGRSELLISGTSLYVLTQAKGLWRVDLTTFDAERILTAAQVGNAPTNFQSDGKYLYWLIGGQLQRMTLATLELALFGATGITGYTLRSDICVFQPCTPKRHVYMGVGNLLRRFDADTRLFDMDIHAAAGTNDRFGDMVVAGNYLFFVEEQQGLCQGFCSHNTLLFRKQRDGNGVAEPIYSGAPGLLHNVNDLAAHDGYLYWIDGSNGTNVLNGEGDTTLKRLPQNAAALPLTNLHIADIEVNQAIQNQAGNVPLIQGKRTFVRVHATPDGESVEGVTARLYRLDGPNGNPIGDPLIPVNPSGAYLTLQSPPNRAVLDGSFLFELPMDWVQGGGGIQHLHLRAEVNPFKYPPEGNYGDNAMSITKALILSPRLALRFALFRYTVEDVTFEPDQVIDFEQTLSWLRRAYPISSEPGYITEGSAGLRVYSVRVTDHELKRYITRQECASDDSMCASDYVHGLLEDWDDEWPHSPAPMYGMMPEYISPYDGEDYFPRGSQSGDTANGPSGIPGGDWNWDTDGSYADWYAGHEIAHLLGRNHPDPAGDPDTGDDDTVGCGHSMDDDEYPYSMAQIGNNLYYGFDPGSPAEPWPVTPRLYPGTGAFDVLSYCHPIQWVSDYTYNGLYSGIWDMAAAQTAQVAQIAMAAATGDYLYVYGVVEPAEATAKFVRVRRKNGSYTPPPAGGDYAIRLLDAANAQLAQMDIPTSADPDQPERLLFNGDLAFTPGTRTVQLIHKPSGQVYAAHSFSAEPPAIGSVTLASASNPVSGNIALSWQASDPDGDPLSFDVHYSTDNGATFQPVAANLTGSSTTIDSSELSGSSQAILRVTAFDGGHTADAATAPFAMANKPPVVKITNPADGIQIHYGQLINLIGDAFDPQWQTFDKASLVWTSQDGPLGSGAMLSLTTLPVGEHTITFTAENAAELEASDSITVIVDDDLSITGPTLQVAPTQLGWHVNEGDTAPQTAQLTIANVGTGSFHWTAETAVPWLSLSASEGNGPATLTVTLDPAQIPAGEDSSTSIIVTATLGVGQVQTQIGQATVPVHASVGNGYLQPFPGPETLPNQGGDLYLPVIRR